MSTDIKAAVFDWGGVLIEDPAPGLRRCCAEALGVSVEDYQQAHACFADAFQRGRLSETQFWRRVCAVLSVPEPTRESLWGWAFHQIYQPRLQVLEGVGRLQRAGIKTALLSNTEVPIVAYFKGLRYTMFDVKVFSCMEGVGKPEDAIYQLLADRLGLPLETCLFIDDREAFVAGAQSLGMQAFQCISEQQVLAVLKQTFDLDVYINDCG